MIKLRQLLYAMLYYSGINRLNSYLNRNKVAILCFHSIAVHDEHQFWPGVFISEKKLGQLLDFLRDSRYQVISLEQAKRHLNGEVCYRYPVVLTIDDGWHHSITKMLPLINSYHFPATVYVTTYYVSHQIPVVNVLVQYLLWRSKQQAINIEFDQNHYEFTGSSGEIVAKIEQVLTNKTDAFKHRFLIQLAQVLDNNQQAITLKLFHNASFDELTAASSDLNNIQLHTHNHHLPVESAGLTQQIIKNKNLLSKAFPPTKPLSDFCYPSGLWQPEQIPQLKALGMTSATTLDEGLNQCGDDLLSLKRNLIMDNRSLLHFKLALSGTFDLLREIKRYLKALAGHST